MAPNCNFVLQPEAIDDQPNFLWSGSYFHLTYATHIETSDLLATVARATSTPLKGYSAVQELAPTLSDDGTQCTYYAHTHLALMFIAPIKLRGCRKFDVYVGTEQFHPNVHRDGTQPTFSQHLYIVSQHPL